MPKFQPELKAKTAEDLQKEDITFRWVELINAAGRLERRRIFKDGATLTAAALFTEKLYNFYYATRFYVNEEVRQKAEKLFLKIKERRATITEMIDVSKEYADACYRKGLFLEEEVIAEEGFEEEGEEVAT